MAKTKPEPDVSTWPLHPVALGDPEVLNVDELVAALGATHDAIRTLRDQEHDLATALGKRVGKTTGTLPDGRQFTLSRSADRKEWDHEDWKRDARRVIVKRLAEHVYAVDDNGELQDPELYGEDGEPVEIAGILHRALAEAQEVHGSTAPRSTALKRLGLYASDYCTSKPSGWRFDAIAPSNTETTTEKD